MDVAVDLGVEEKRPLRDVAHPLLVRAIDLARARARDVLRGRPAGRPLERAVDLIAPAWPLARVGLEAESGGDDDAEPRTPAELGGDLAGARIRAAVGCGDHDAPTPDLSRDLPRPPLEVGKSSGGRAAGDDERAERHPSRPPESPARAHSHLRGSARAACGCRPWPGRSHGRVPTGPGWAPARARGAPRARASARRAASLSPRP